MQYQNFKSCIEYFPLLGTAVFHVPRIYQSSIAEVKLSIDAFLESVKRLRICNVIINGCQSDVAVEDRTFQLALDYLIIGIKYTEVRCIARIPFIDIGWESKAGAIFAQASVIWPSSAQSGCFLNLPEAKCWFEHPVPVAL